MLVLFYKLNILLCLIYIPFCACIGPITTSFGAAIAALGSSVFYGYIQTPWQEKCGQKWNDFVADDLDSNLKKHLIGQHLVASTVTNALRAHIMKKEPKKALTMSFHGWTGGGKNFVAKILADTLYNEGSKSAFVHWYITTRDFPHAEETKMYRERLLREIAEHTKLCGQSLFIFDEIDKMHPGVIDGLKPFLDFYEDLDGIDYRRNIFLFLSNAGGSEITKVALNYWMEGKDREDVVMKDIEPLVNKGAFNEKGGLYHSEVIQRNLIDIYVPFLPLEKKHVRKCILIEMQNRGLNVNNEILDIIQEQMMYFPSEFQLFSTSGCKKVSSKIDIYGYETKR